MTGNTMETTVRELKQIPVERTSIPADRTRHKLARYGRKRRNRSAIGLIGIASASLALNMVQSVIIYVLQAGPI